VPGARLRAVPCAAPSGARRPDPHRRADRVRRLRGGPAGPQPRRQNQQVRTTFGRALAGRSENLERGMPGPRARVHVAATDPPEVFSARTPPAGARPA
jgi:hypothetical protein